MENIPRASETVWLLRAAIQQYGARIRRALADGGYHDLPPRGLWAIGVLQRCGGSATSAALVEELRVTKQAVSQLVELLVSLGYVRRDDDPSDGRRKLIVLTERGMRAGSIIEETCANYDAQLADRLGANVLRFQQLLNEVAHLEKAAATGLE